jgi:hypothetical protein
MHLLAARAGGGHSRRRRRLRAADEHDVWDAARFEDALARSSPSTAASPRRTRAVADQTLIEDARDAPLRSAPEADRPGRRRLRNLKATSISKANARLRDSPVHSRRIGSKGTRWRMRKRSERLCAARPGGRATELAQPELTSIGREPMHAPLVRTRIATRAAATPRHRRGVCRSTRRWRLAACPARAADAAFVAPIATTRLGRSRCPGLWTLQRSRRARYTNVWMLSRPSAGGARAEPDGTSRRASIPRRVERR